MSFISFLLGLAAGGLFSLGMALGGGLLAQLSSILDGCDGEIARLTSRQSARGAILDSILDRLADGALITGMTVFAYRTSLEGAPLLAGNPLWPVIWGFLALIGSYGISYSSAIARAMGRRDYPRVLAGRDLRLFLIMLAGITAAALPSVLTLFLILLALSTLVELAVRLIRT